MSFNFKSENINSKIMGKSCRNLDRLKVTKTIVLILGDDLHRLYRVDQDKSGLGCPSILKISTKISTKMYSNHSKTKVYSMRQ